MRGLYLLVTLSLIVSLLSLCGVFIVYQQVNNLNSAILQLSQNQKRLDELHNAILRIQSELKSIRLNFSQHARTVVSLQQNLTAAEIVYEKVKDSVVLIKATILVETLFGKAYASSQGSGFVYDEQGHIVTNYHVIEGAVRVEVFFRDKSAYIAEIVGVDPYSDLAVLKIDAKDKPLHPLVLGNSSLLKVGQPVVAIGNPYGFEVSLTAGVISQLNRLLKIKTSEGSWRYIPNVIQFDAAVNPGSSGGPLLDYSGKVIGVTSAIYTRTGEFAGIGFAIPSNMVAKVVKSLIETGRYAHPYIGIYPVDVNAEIARKLNLPETRGVLVYKVYPGTPAEKAGLRDGDIILEVDGMKILGLADFLGYIEEHKRPGDSIMLTIYRDGEFIEVSLTLGAVSA